MKWFVPGILIIFLFTCCNTGRVTNDGPDSDSTMLLKKDSAFILSSSPAIIPVSISKNKSKLYNSNKKIYLQLHGTLIKTQPDGVYELYLTKEKPDIRDLTSASRGYVSGLNLYKLTEPGAMNMIEVDISDVVKQLFPGGEINTAFYMVVIFRGNIGTNGISSSEGGMIQASGINIFQTK